MACYTSLRRMFDRIFGSEFERHWPLMGGSSMDRIALNGLEFFGRHGVFAEEGKLGGRFVVDIEMFLSLEGAFDLEQTVSYAEVFETVKVEATEKRYALIEALANQIALRLLEEHVLLERVLVRVHKPHAPIQGVFRDVFVEVLRSRT